ncbi:unnamed protein product [Paramecium octaurelia]|uniref:Tetratricopeptide repeat protein n=1 Tax=Paramecium octaurelia TaxID=43137 RepID=A0A8S1SMQ0_PAROT|nr:unnamed protein product [Paramecium octaurelia]
MHQLNWSNIKSQLIVTPKLFILILNLILHGVAKDMHQAVCINFMKQLNVSMKPFLLTQICNTLKTLNQYEDAIECYNEAISINPKDEDAWYSKGLALFKLNQFEEAIECYNEAISIKPKYLYAWYDKGLALFKLNQFEEAIECYNEAISIKPKYLYAWYDKGLALFKLNQFEEAIKCYNEAISINPKYDNAWHNKGSTLFNLNQFQEAIQCYNEAISINPKYDNAWHNKGSTLFNLNQFEEAIQCYNEAISINPKFHWAFENIGLILQNQQKNMDALTIFEQSLKINPYALRLKYKANSLFELRRSSQAKFFYFAALEMGLDQNAYIKSKLSKITSINLQFQGYILMIPFKDCSVRQIVQYLINNQCLNVVFQRKIFGLLYRKYQK